VKINLAIILKYGIVLTVEGDGPCNVELLSNNWPTNWQREHGESRVPKVKLPKISDQLESTLRGKDPFNLLFRTGSVSKNRFGFEARFNSMTGPRGSGG